MHKAHQEVDSRLKILVDDNTKLSNERDSLAMTAKNLSRDLAKLETFKRQLMRSLNDNNSCSAETVDIGTCDLSVPRAYPDKDEGTNGDMTQRSFSGSTRSFSGSTNMGNTIDEASRNTGQIFSDSIYHTTAHSNWNPKSYFHRCVPWRLFPCWISLENLWCNISYKTSILWTDFAIFMVIVKPAVIFSKFSASWAFTSRRYPRIDGKELFCQSRSCLSYEQFSAFLASIKELNAQKQTREETLRKAEEIFGTDNKDLYLYFQGLLNRNVH